jgi:hypothetical protein
MDNEVVLTYVFSFLEPEEAFRIFSSLSKYARDLWFLKLYAYVKPLDVDEIMVNTNSDSSSARLALLCALFRDPRSVLGAKAPNGDEMIHKFARKGKPQLVSLLIRHNAELNSRGCGQMTPLHCAAFAKSTDTCQILLNAGADPSLRDSIGRLPEDWARMQSYPELQFLLLAARVDEEVSTPPSCTGCWKGTKTSFF